MLGKCLRRASAGRQCPAEEGGTNGSGEEFGLPPSGGPCVEPLGGYVSFFPSWPLRCPRRGFFYARTADAAGPFVKHEMCPPAINN
jgi:hypothetical protein